MSEDRNAAATESSGLSMVALIAGAARPIFAAGLAGAVLLGLLALARPARFSSTLLLVPSAPPAGPSGQLGGLASQLGLGDMLGGGGSPTATAAFMTQLATSEVILARLLDDTVTTAQDAPESTTLLALAAPERWLSLREESEPRRRVRAVKELRRWISARSDRETGSARITVRTKWPQVSLHIAQRIAQELDRLNIELTTARAASERRFLQARLSEQQQTLRGAEQLLERFLATNREFSASPALTFQRDRLQRDVTLQQQLLTTLAQSLEDARLREVQNTPVVTVVEPARYPYVSDARNTLQRGILGFLAAASAVVAFVVLHHLLRERAGQGDADARQLLQVLDRLPFRRRSA